MMEKDEGCEFSARCDLHTSNGGTCPGSEKEKFGCARRDYPDYWFK